MSPLGESCRVGFMWSELLESFDFGAKHPIQPGRFRSVRDYYEACGFLDLPNVQLLTPVPLSEAELSQIHTLQYLEEVRRISETGDGAIDVDTPGFEGIYENASITSGATVTGVRQVVSRVIDHFISPTGGFHHAKREHGGGFCIFNDIAAGVLELKRSGFQKILIADFDVHHGNGSQEYFYDDPGVMQISFHEDPEWMFPHEGYIEEIGRGDGVGHNINMPFPMDSGDAVYRYAFDELVPPLVNFYEPDFVIFLPGIDAHYKDTLAHLVLTTDMIRYVADKIHTFAHDYCDGKLGVLAGGGYHPEAFKWGMASVMSALTGHPYEPPPQEPPFEDNEETWSEVRRNVSLVKDLVFSELGLD
jgi:acetoin utilization protein AcuC